jgi:predicted nucleotidyltransferase
MALKTFVTEIRRRFGPKILSLYLFGSTAKGTAVRGSDIDVLVVYTGLREKELLDAISEISFEIALSTGESIEATLMTKEEYERALGSSPFLWEVLTFGRPIFTKLRSTQWRLNFQGYLTLAGEYLGYAKGALRRGEIRLAIDAEYNALELLVKALIISTQNPLASSHGGPRNAIWQAFRANGRNQPRDGKGTQTSSGIASQSSLQT